MDLYSQPRNWQEVAKQPNSGGCVLSLVDREGKYLYVNQGWKNINQDDEPLGNHYSDINPNTKVSEVIRTGRPQYGYYNDGNPESIGFFAAYIPIFENGEIQKVAVFSIPGANLQTRGHASKTNLKTRYSINSIIGQSKLCYDLRKQVEQYAPAYAPVVIEGETGTGKELIAQALHSESGREGPFVSINCASIPESLFEAEFFGYVDGAFTGARRGGHAGLLESANGGTLFLDEVHHLTLPFQAKLLRALQEKQIMRVGGVEPIHIKTRIICATNQSLKKLVGDGAFREDLYFRLNVLSIHVPPLRDRAEDIPMLARKFLQEYSTLYAIVPPRMDESAMKTLETYSWPGNIRELQNVIERAVVCHGQRESVFKAELFDLDCEENFDKRTKRTVFSNETEDQTTLTVLREIFAAEERNLLVQALEECDGNKSLAAKKLDISRTLLYNKMKEYGIEG